MSLEKQNIIQQIPSLLILLFLLFFMNVIIIIYIIAGTPSPLVSTRSVDFFVLAKCINYFLIHSILVLVLYCILLVFYLKVNIKQKAVISWSFCFAFSLFRQWQNLKFQKPDCFNICNFQNSKSQKNQQRKEKRKLREKKRRLSQKKKGKGKNEKKSGKGKDDTRSERCTATVSDDCLTVSSYFWWWYRFSFPLSILSKLRSYPK